MDQTDVRTRWAMLALIFATRVGLGFQFQAMGSVADDVSVRLNLSAAETGTLIGLFLIPGLVLSIPAGFAGRYTSDRMLVALGLACLTLGSALAAIGTSFAMLAAGRLLCGVGFVFCSIYYTKMVADWFAGRELATAMAILVMSWPFGIAMGQVGHAWLATSLGWQAPFVAASLYCLVGVGAMLVAYRPPRATTTTATMAPTPLTSREWTLTLIAAVIWATFNAGYVVYLSFAPRVLVAGGLGTFEAASVLSLASWVMIFSGALCGWIADRTGRPDAILVFCLCCAMVSLALLPQVAWAIPVSLLFGLLGVAPAGVVMALTGQAMAPQNRAFGMGIFMSVFFLLTGPAPALAGWLYDRTADPFVPILLAIAMFGSALVFYVVFRIAQRMQRLRA
jgi:predicted MFS family arabinose efflux permease